MNEKEIEYIIDENGCHVCTSHPLSGGYPKIKRGGKPWILSRYIYTINNGPIPDGMLVRHTCDNRACININHLELGTHLDNCNDKISRGRMPQGEDRGAAKLTNEQVLDIYNSTSRATYLAKKYKVTRSIISGIKVKRIWKFLTKDLPIINYEGSKRLKPFN